MIKKASILTVLIINDKEKSVIYQLKGVKIAVFSNLRVYEHRKTLQFG